MRTLGSAQRYVHLLPVKNDTMAHEFLFQELMLHRATDAGLDLYIKGMSRSPTSWPSYVYVSRLQPVVILKRYDACDRCMSRNS
jgi:hypothetical protein